MKSGIIQKEQKIKEQSYLYSMQSDYAVLYELMLVVATNKLQPVVVFST